jgi:endonuclease/exonuclease/phosphatase family metal-dependent hydrolase
MVLKSSRSFYKEARSSNDSLDSVGSTLKVYTHNVACLPSDSLFRGNVNELVTFQKTVADKGYDIIALQEVFETIRPPSPTLVEKHYDAGLLGRLRILLKGFQQNGVGSTKHKRTSIPSLHAFGTRFHPRFWKNIDSGLLTYSKWNIVTKGTPRSKFFPFNLQTDPIERGMLCSIIQIPGIEKHILHINTHLSPNHHPDADRIRTLQILQLIQKVTTFYSPYLDRIVLTGDLNVDIRGDERSQLDLLMAGLRLITVSEADIPDRTFLGNEKEDPQTLDYVLISRDLGEIVELTAVTGEESGGFGDHAPLVATIKLNMDCLQGDAEGVKRLKGEKRTIQKCASSDTLVNS